MRFIAMLLLAEKLDMCSEIQVSFLNSPCIILADNVLFRRDILAVTLPVVSVVRGLIINKLPKKGFNK